MSDEAKTRPGESVPEPDVDVVDENLALARLRGRLFRRTEAPTLDAQEGRDPGVDVDGGAPPVRVGRFVIVRPLGSGGMGVVYAAYDEQLDRKVAVKVLLRRLSSIARERVAREARAMAKLAHPNVVHVYEVGDDAGVIYIAMEFVEGETLGEWERKESRTWREVLTAYRQAGLGLAAAHAAGLVHRDFKPHNVMVKTSDGPQLQVKVLDFGLARQRDDSRSSETEVSDASQRVPDDRLTAEGALVGTPAYMAPEQFSSGDVTAAADQFSFCVSLWEGLYGVRPFRATGVAELIVAVTRGERPAVPDDAEVPTWVGEVIRRGLAVHPTDRWPSMNALLTALGRAPGLARRNWLLASGAVGLLFAGAAVAGDNGDAIEPCTGARKHLDGVWDEARRKQVRAAMLDADVPFAAKAWEQADARVDAFAEAWVAMHTETCAATTLHGEQSAQVMDLRMACLHRARQDLVAVTDVLADSDAEVVAKAHEVTDALQGLERCADVESLRAGVEPPAPEDAEAVDATLASVARAEVERKAGRFPRARTTLEEAAEILETVDYAPARIQHAFALGATLEAQGEYVQARESMERALDLAIEHRDLDRVQRIASEMLHLVGYRMGQHEEAMQRYRQLAEGFAGSDDARADAGNSVASVLKVQGKYAEAAAKEHEVLALRIQIDGPEHANTGTAHTNLAITLNDLGDFKEAEKEVRQGLAIEEATLGAEHPTLGNTHNSLAIALNGQGKLAEAEAEHRRALEIRSAALGAEHPDVAQSRNNLAVILARQNRLDEAEAEFRRVVALWDEILGPDHPHASAAHHNLAIVFEMRESFEEAEAEYRRALEMRRSKLDEDHPDVANTRSALASLLIRRGDVDEALEHAELAWRRLQRDDVSSPVRGDAAFTLARALWGTQDRPARRRRARELAAVAHREYDRAGAGAGDHAAKLQAWADEHGIKLGP